MTTGVISVAPETSIRDAVELLATKHLTGAPVLSGDQLVGVVSATDLMTFLAQLPGLPTPQAAGGEGYDDDVPATSDEAEYDAAWQSAYFVELWDCVGADTSARLESHANPEWDVLAEHDVSEVMTRTPLHTVLPNDSAEHAARMMEREGIHRVLVVEGERVVGIVSALDITKAAADHRLSTRTYVFNHDEYFRDRVR